MIPKLVQVYFQCELFRKRKLEHISVFSVKSVFFPFSKFIFTLFIVTFKVDRVPAVHAASQLSAIVQHFFRNAEKFKILVKKSL